MTLSTVVIFGDGREETIRDDYDEFGDAVSHAVQLADDHGNDHGDGHGPPEWVIVKRGNQIAISLKVLRGGLINGRGGE